MIQASPLSPEVLQERLERIVAELCRYYPKALLLFGSAVTFLQNPLASPQPNDLDLLLVIDNPLLDVSFDNTIPPVELHRFRIDEVTAVARSLRYDCKALALTKLYAKNVTKQHARDVILAAILLGPPYNDFGIEQIERQGKPDPRDYSRHLVLYGHEWWQRLADWARERRSIFQLLADKMVMADRFQ